jgi:hypothetical protein
MHKNCTCVTAFPTPFSFENACQPSLTHIDSWFCHSHLQLSELCAGPPKSLRAPPCTKSYTCVTAFPTQFFFENACHPSLTHIDPWLTTHIYISSNFVRDLRSYCPRPHAQKSCTCVTAFPTLFSFENACHPSLTHIDPWLTNQIYNSSNFVRDLQSHCPRPHAQKAAPA